MAIYSGPEIPNDGLILNLDAANPRSYPGTGTTWSDLSGNGNNGTLVNGVGYSSDNKGIMTFDGVNDYVGIPSITLARAGSAIEFWIYIENFTTTTDISAVTVMSDTSTVATSRLISFWNGGFGFETNTNSDPVEFAGQTSPPISVPAITSGIWFQFSIVFSSNVSYSYLNGSLVDSRAVANSVTFRNIGRVSTNLNYPSWFKGRMGSVKIYNRTLLSTEIEQLYEANRDRYGI
jgi:hypothetical protein